VTENLPPEPQEGTKTLRLPKSVVENQTPSPSKVVENLPLNSFLLRKSKKMAEIKAWLQKMWQRIDHLFSPVTPSKTCSASTVSSRLQFYIYIVLTWNLVKRD